MESRLNVVDRAFGAASADGSFRRRIPGNWGPAARPVERPAIRQTWGMARQEKSFRCVHCHREVDLSAPGTQHRNHCPYCLWSRHVDEIRPGDRGAECQASMEPIAISVRKDGEWVLIHRCNGCGVLDSNRAAGDDSP
ncbi:MAG TPA: RNHCP domain-containing protein, partial [Candidatus Limnocylindrales bacterium]